MTTLKRQLSLFDLSMLSIGAMIGSGIFLTPSSIYQALPSPAWVLAIWIFVGLTGLAGALTYAELGGMMPGAGGIYVYLSQAYGGLFGFLYGWIYLTVVNSGSLAALSLAFARYLSYLIPLSPTGVIIVAVAGLILLTAINVRGVRAGALFSDLFTVLKIIGIGGLIITGFFFGKQTITLSADPGVSGGELTGALAMAMLGVMWAYGGWHHTSFVSGEARNPRRDVPKAMIIGAAAVTLIYVLTNLAYLFLLTPGQIAGSGRVAADAVQQALGPIGGALIALAIFISTFGTSGIYTLAAPRIYFAMANDGLFFKKIAHIHPRYQTPAAAIILQNTWAIILILFWGTFESLISYVVFTDAIFYALTAAAVFVFRKRRPNDQRPIRTFGYPFTPLLFIGMYTFFVVISISRKPLESLAGFCFVLLGVPIYYFWKRKKSRPDGASATAI